MVAIVAVASTLYGISTTSPTIIQSGTAQFGDFTYNEWVERHALVVVGTVTDVNIKMFTEETMDTDEKGIEYVLDTKQVPKAEVTILISETLKDDIGLTSKTVTFYDRAVDGQIGKINGEVTLFNSQYAIDYQIGDTGIFMIENDRGLSSMGFTSFYQIFDGKTTVTTELDKLVENSPINLTVAMETAKLVATQD